jgi:hypothetical protein
MQLGPEVDCRMNISTDFLFRRKPLGSGNFLKHQIRQETFLTGSNDRKLKKRKDSLYSMLKFIFVHSGIYIYIPGS